VLLTEYVIPNILFLIYFKGSGVKIFRYPVTVIGMIQPRNQRFQDSHWATGKAGWKIRLNIVGP